jgi:hypothetical protein
MLELTRVLQYDLSHSLRLYMAYICEMIASSHGGMIDLDMRTTREIYKVGQGEESAHVIM